MFNQNRTKSNYSAMYSFSRIICNFAADMKKIVWIFIAVMLVACGDRKQQEAELMLQRAKTLFAERHYDRALIVIDSLRKVYPKAIDIRKQALKLYQDVELQQAQETLAMTDSVLEIVKKDYERQKIEVEKKKSELRATPEELTRLTKTRVLRDSLQTEFEMLCAKIRYIHKKQKELKN